MKDCYITVKDHKDNDENNKVDKVSKIMLSKILKVLRDKRSIVTWKTPRADERIYSLNMKECFITVKDHKDNYENNTKCRLLNPSKSELGKVSKIILSKIVWVLRKKCSIVIRKTLRTGWQNVLTEYERLLHNSERP